MKGAAGFLDGIDKQIHNVNSSILFHIVFAFVVIVSIVTTHTYMDQVSFPLAFTAYTVNLYLFLKNLVVLYPIVRMKYSYANYKDECKILLHLTERIEAKILTVKSLKEVAELESMGKGRSRLNYHMEVLNNLCLNRDAVESKVEKIEEAIRNYSEDLMKQTRKFGI